MPWRLRCRLTLVLVFGLQILVGREGIESHPYLDEFKDILRPHRKLPSNRTRKRSGSW